MQQTAVLQPRSYARPSRRFEVYTLPDLERGRIAPIAKLPRETRFAMQVVAQVLPFRVNAYVVEELIDWDRAPDDPIFQLTFPQPDMLAPEDFSALADLLSQGASKAEIQARVQAIRQTLNPHPAGQMELNMPRDEEGNPINGLQHKYRETVLFFPSQGQTCHSYCSFCFRWAQFVGDRELRIASRESDTLHRYLRRHPEVTDVLITGGDPMVMKTKHLENYLLPLLGPEFDHVRTIRIGTKSLSFWPYRYLTDHDSDDLLRLLEKLVRGGKQVAVMAHYNHWQELETDAAREAIERVRATGAMIRSQGPLLAHINDDPDAWARLWQTQVELGISPYYMFVERDTGARRYFEVPLARCWEIYREAIQQVSGLARTARGPSMSAGPGKVEIQGITRIGDEKAFVLRFLQGRNPDWVQRPFFARYDDQATWLDQLRPAFGEDRFFFEPEFDAMQGAVKAA
ncbi:MAG: KamA family radical SAM protein [Methylohalobius crimeensis]